jgi:ribosome-associated translation inhibitor RaiA
MDTGRRGPIVSEAVHEDLYTAISQVADRISEAVSREVDRVHHHHDHRTS